MTNGNGRIKFPINEPAAGKKKSQIQEFLDYYLDAGTQHIALRTEDIVETVRTLRERASSSSACPTPITSSSPNGSATSASPIETLEELGIEADRDEEGYLLQIFTRPIQDRPTFFFRSSSATGRAASASATSRRCSRRSRSSRPGEATSRSDARTMRRARDVALVS